MGVAEMKTELMQDVPSILYKYLGDREWHLDVLRRLRIRFTQPEDLNDLLDCMPDVLPPKNPRAFVEKTFERNRELINKRRPPKHVMRKYKRSKIREYTRRPEDLLKRGGDIVRKAVNIAGVLSLTERNDIMPMWAHYAANHSGFAVGVRTVGRPLARVDKDVGHEGVLRKVVYRKDRVAVHVDQMDMSWEMLFTKGLDWSYEREWRIVRQLQNRDDVLPDEKGVRRICVWNIDPEAIDSVYLGLRVTERVKSEVLSATAPGTPLQHVRVYEARLGVGRFDLEFAMIRDGVRKAV